ncbi:hypothetical protein [Methylomonas sp. ZR1]|uniref:hypothetical protein n=1 Tax=Methylomonas sp. ZR1 TaxID=1797072 RepID=UPI00149260D8|nr:hypothetical protein [Methylomonas sp. ZR1]NOV32718.1 hypothetical protein [Methylomonas sp. ZR1]
MSFTPEIDNDLFERVSLQLRRWSDRSLGVAKALIIDGVPLSEAAAMHDMSPQQANVIRTRFVEKADKVRLQSFMAREKPKLPKIELELFKPEIQTLHEKGYTVEQIITFLAENNVTASATTIRNFLKGN